MNKSATLKSEDYRDNRLPPPKRRTLHLSKAIEAGDAFPKDGGRAKLLPKEEDCRDRATD